MGERNHPRAIVPLNGADTRPAHSLNLQRGGDMTTNDGNGNITCHDCGLVYHSGHIDCSCWQSHPEDACGRTREQRQKDQAPKPLPHRRDRIRHLDTCQKCVNNGVGKRIAHIDCYRRQYNDLLEAARWVEPYLVDMRTRELTEVPDPAMEALVAAIAQIDA